MRVESKVRTAQVLQAPGGEAVGVGLVNYGASDIRRIMGLGPSTLQVLGHKPYDEGGFTGTTL